MTTSLDYRTRHTPMPRPHVTLDAGTWLLLGIGFAIIGAGLLVMIGGSIGAVARIAGVPVPMGGLILLIAGSALLIALRRGRGNAVLAYVEQAVRLNLPLPAMLAAAERAEQGRLRLTLERLRIQLEGGAPLHVALTAALPALPMRTAQLIASAERVGRLPQALHRLTRPGRAEGTALTAIRGNEFLRWYPLLTLAILVAVALLFFVFVVPKYEEIFRDFNMALPPLTVAVLAFGRSCIFPLAVLLGLVLMAALARTVGTIFAPRWASTNPFRMLTDRLAWFVPPIRAVVRARAMADACHVAADTLESGRPLIWAVDEAARAQSNAVLAYRLADWAERMRQGADTADAAKAARLPDLLVGLLRTAAGADMADLLRFLARYYDGRFSRGVVLLRAALVPAAAIGTGVPVCLFVLSLYLPLIRLIDGMSEFIWTI